MAANSVQKWEEDELKLVLEIFLSPIKNLCFLVILS